MSNNKDIKKDNWVFYNGTQEEAIAYLELIKKRNKLWIIIILVYVFFICPFVLKGAAAPNHEMFTYLTTPLFCIFPFVALHNIITCNNNDKKSMVPMWVAILVLLSGILGMYLY